MKTISELLRTNGKLMMMKVPTASRRMCFQGISKQAGLVYSGKYYSEHLGFCLHQEKMSLVEHVGIVPKNIRNDTLD